MFIRMASLPNRMGVTKATFITGSVTDTSNLAGWNDCWRLWVTFMTTSSNRNIFHFTGPLCGEFTGHRWIHRWITLTKASDAELWCDLRRHRAHYDVIVMVHIGKCHHSSAAETPAKYKRDIQSVTRNALTMLNYYTTRCQWSNPMQWIWKKHAIIRNVLLT